MADPHPSPAPSADPSRVADHLAANLRQLREVRGLSQARASALAGIPRPTWATLEAGGSNPTLAVLLRVASALQVTLEELVAPPRASGRLYKASELATRQRGSVTVRHLLPDPMPGLDLERMELPPGAAMSGIPHTPGTREYLACETGRIALSAAGQTWELDAGDVVVFRGDQRHGYRNIGAGVAVGYSVIVLSPVDLR